MIKPVNSEYLFHIMHYNITKHEMLEKSSLIMMNRQILKADQGPMTSPSAGRESAITVVKIQFSLEANGTCHK